MIQEFVTNPLQKVDYNYNIRGWLKGINDTNSLSVDLFSFKINYNTVENTISNAISPLYNGNIAETKWRTSSDNVLRRYGYQYDNLNRLTNAIYQKPNNAVPVTNSYNESLTYDKNGNITALQRNGEYDDAMDVLQIDNLTYSYNTSIPNQLLSVFDTTNNPKGFSDGATVSTDVDFQYDANGNMIKDKNKNMDITYNHLNLPLKITFASLNYIEYLYNAVGQKVKKVVKNGAVTTTTDYLSGYQYVNNVLEFFPTAEGYVKNTVISGVNNYNYIYNYTDHLGNIRLSYTFDNATSSLKIVEENNYYPFGLKHKNYNQDIRTYQGIESGEIRVIPAERLSYQYRYNQKEWQDELGLNWYDYGARNYDPAIGRWMNTDPLAEASFSLTPYRYSGNNPVIFKDVNGLWEFQYNSDTKELSLNKSNDDDNIESFMKESGLNEGQIKRLLFGGGKNGQAAMDNFFGGGESSINVSALSGKLGKMLNGMEKALNEGNIQLAENQSEDPRYSINNCHNTTINLTTDGSVDSKPLAKYDSPQSYVTNPFLFDDTLINNYSNVSNPRLGDAIRYSNDNGNTTLMVQFFC